MTSAVCAVTGASGYVGSKLVAALGADFTVVSMGRNAAGEGIRWSMNGPDVESDLRRANANVLVHAAWDMRETNAKRNWESNVEGTRKLLAQARNAGVDRVVFISSISAFEGARSEYGKSKVAVEKLVLAGGGVVIRPGLVWGQAAQGMFGSIRKQISGGSIIPLIGDGRNLQYMVHEDDLAEAVRLAALGQFDGKLLTVAHPSGQMLRDLITGIAASQNKQIKTVQVPWRAVYGGLKLAESLGLKLGFRSDSVLSLIHANPKPAFSTEIPVRPFSFQLRSY